MISDPFCSVWPWLQYATSFRTPKHRSDVLPFCLTSPFTIVFSPCLSASPRMCVATRAGPRGAYLSKDLLKDHWGTGPALSVSRCQSRAETSLPTV